MLEPAILYKEEIIYKLRCTWLDEQYKYLYCDAYVDDWKIEESNWLYTQLVSIYDGKIVGYIQYKNDRQSNNVSSFVIVGFENDARFIRDIQQAVDDIFNRFHFNKMHFSAIPENPAAKIYDKYIEKLGGRVVGIYEKEWKCSDNKFYDKKLYEIMRYNYRRLCSRGK